eukprot:8004759-Pyramimonas_sp.AAC.1
MSTSSRSIPRPRAPVDAVAVLVILPPRSPNVPFLIRVPRNLFLAPVRNCAPPPWGYPRCVMSEGVVRSA